MSNQQSQRQPLNNEVGSHSSNGLEAQQQQQQQQQPPVPPSRPRPPPLPPRRMSSKAKMKPQQSSEASASATNGKSAAVSVAADNGQPVGVDAPNTSASAESDNQANSRLPGPEDISSSERGSEMKRGVENTAAISSSSPPVCENENTRVPNKDEDDDDKCSERTKTGQDKEELDERTRKGVVLKEGGGHRVEQGDKVTTGDDRARDRDEDLDSAGRSGSDCEVLCQAGQGRVTPTTTAVGDDEKDVRSADRDAAALARVNRGSGAATHSEGVEAGTSGLGGGLVSERIPQQDKNKPSADRPSESRPSVAVAEETTKEDCELTVPADATSGLLPTPTLTIGKGQDQSAAALTASEPISTACRVAAEAAAEAAASSTTDAPSSGTKSESAAICEPTLVKKEKEGEKEKEEEGEGEEEEEEEEDRFLDKATQTIGGKNLVLNGTCNHFFWMAKFDKMASQNQPWQKDAADQNFDYMFKLLIIGNSSVGKTSFLFRYADDSFTSAFVSTVGIDFKVKTVFRQDKRVKLQIWDTAGQERYRTITTAYYRGAMGFILMYDVTNEESFASVHDWCTQIKTYSWDNAQVILVGNKSDMEDERVISYERGKQLAESLGLEFFETSAKENINVRAVFERLVDIICDKMSESLDSDPNVMNANKGTRLDSAQPSHVNCNC